MAYLQNLGLTSTKAEETAVTIVNTAAKKSNASASAAQIGVNAGLLASIKATTAGLLAQAAAWLTTPVGIILAIGGAIYGIAAAIDYASKAYERQVEKVNALSSEYEELTGKISSIETEIDSVGEKLDILNSKGLNITDEEESEKKRLENINEQLRIQLDIQNELAKIKGKEVEEETVKLLERPVASYAPVGENGLVDVSIPDRVQINIDHYTSLQHTIEELNEAQAELARTGQTSSEQFRINADEIERNSALANQFYEEILLDGQALGEYSKNLVGATEDGDQWKLSIESITDAIDIFIKTLKGVPVALDGASDGSSFGIQLGTIDELNKSLDGIQSAYQATSKAIDEYNKMGYLSVDTYQNLLANSSSYLGYLVDEEGQLTLTKESLEALTNARIEDLALQQAQALVDTIGTYEDSAEELENLASSYEDAAESQWALIDAQLVTKNLSPEILANYRAQIQAIREMSDAAQAGAKAELNPDVDFAKSLNDALESYRNATNEFEEMHWADAANTALAGLKQQAELGNISWDEYAEAVNRVDMALTGLSTSTKEIISSADMLSNAFKEQDDNGKLSLNTILNLIDSGYALALTYDAETNSMRLDKEITIQLIKAKLEMQIANLKIQQSNLESTLIEEGNAARTAAGEFLFLATAKTIASEEYASAEAQIKALGDVLANVGKIAAGTFTSGIKKAAGATKDLAAEARKLASEAKSDIDDLLRLTMQMIRKDYETLKDSIGDAMDELKDLYDIQVEAEKELAKEQKERLKLVIEGLEKQRDQSKKIYDDNKKALDDELDAYRKKIEAQIRMLKLLEEEHDYRRALAEKQKDISAIEGKLFELEGDDSAEAQKKRLLLQEELAQKTDELQEFQHDKEVDRQIQALEDELKRFEDTKQAEIDILEQRYKREDEFIKAQIEAQKAYQDSLDEYHDKRLADLEAEYEAARALKQRELDDLEKYLSDEVGVRTEALELMEKRSDEYYLRLIDYNHRYGSGIDAEIKVAWDNAYKALDAYGDGQKSVLDILNDLVARMNEFKTATEKATSAQGDLNRKISEQPPQQTVQATVPQGGTGRHTMTAYATGGVNDFTDFVKMDGTPTHSEVVFNSADAKKLFDYVNQTPNLMNDLLSNIKDNVGAFSQIQNINTSSPFSISIGDISFTGGSSEITRGDLVSWEDSLVNRVFSTLQKQMGFRGIRNANRAGM